MSDLLRQVLVSAALFIPVAGIVGFISLMVTRRAGAGRSRRAQRVVLLAAAFAVAATATGRLWVREEALASHLTSVLISLAVPLATYLIVLLIIGWTNRRIQDDAMRLKTRKAIIYLGLLVVVLTLAKVWLLRQEVNLTTVLSVIGAGIALALQQQILCLAGWLTLLTHRYYDVGDRVQIGEIKGDVSDIEVLHTTLIEIGNWVDAEQSTGRLVTVPNSYVFSHAIYNYTRGFEYIWNELSVLVTFESNWRKAQQLMLDFAQEDGEQIEEKFRTQIRHMSDKYLIHFRHLTPIVYPKILDSGVQLTLRYLCEPKRRRSTMADLTAKILDAFAREPDVDFAYPTVRRYDAAREGKPNQPRAEGHPDNR